MGERGHAGWRKVKYCDEEQKHYPSGKVKVVLHGKKQAETSAARMRARTGDPSYEAYHCRFKNHWHAGRNRFKDSRELPLASGADTSQPSECEEVRPRQYVVRKAAEAISRLGIKSESLRTTESEPTIKVS